MLYFKRIIVMLLVLIYASFSFCKINNAFNKSLVFLKSNKKILQKNEEFEISVNLSNNKTAAFTCFIYFDNKKIEYVSGPENVNVIDNKIIFVWYDIHGGSGAKQGELANFKFIAKDNSNINFSVDGEYYSEDGQLINTEFNGVKIGSMTEESLNLNNMELSEKSVTNFISTNNTNLETLAIENVLLYPAFDNDITHYNAEISNDISELNVLAIPENQNATAIIKGKENIKEGTNQMIITVIAQDNKTKKDFVIDVYKRNKDEEKVFKNEQDMQKYKLEEAYNIEKTSTNIDTETGSKQNKEEIKDKEKLNKFYYLIFVGIGILFLMVIFVTKRYFYIKKPKDTNLPSKKY